MTKTVVLADEEVARLLFWLHTPVPPGPMRDLDIRLIWKLS
jgi:hypothetical protein